MTITDIKQIVAEQHELRTEDLDRKTRKREIVVARQTAHYFAITLLGCRSNGWQTRKGWVTATSKVRSLDEIGAAIGGKDHATVLNSFRVITNLADTDKSFKAGLDMIEAHLTMSYVPQY